MESEFDPGRGTLGTRMKRTAPAGLADKVMGEVLYFERRRIYRRLVVAMILRSAVFLVILLLMLLPVISHGIRVDDVWRSVQGLEHGGVRMLNDLYFLAPLIVLLFVRRLFAIK